MYTIMAIKISPRTVAAPKVQEILTRYGCIIPVSYTHLKNLEGEDNLDEFFMKKALELARKGEGYVNPNPLVGAVIVKGGEIIEMCIRDSCNSLRKEDFHFNR